MRSTLLLTLCLAAGCTSQQYSPDTAKDEQAKDRNTARKVTTKAHVPAPLARKRVRLDHDAESAHRARHFYLQGVRLIQDQPPRIDEAIREFQISLEHDPLFYKAHFKLGYCYYHKGLYQREIAEYKKCLALNPEYQPALLNLGHAHLARDELEEAREAYLKVIERQPNHPIARYNLGLVEFDLEQYESAAEHLKVFLRTQTKKTPQTKHARTVLKRIQERLKELEDRKPK